MCKLHGRPQAANLPPAADGSGTANPFLVVRFAGHTAQLPVKEDTLYPTWCGGGGSERHGACAARR